MPFGVEPKPQGEETATSGSGNHAYEAHCPLPEFDHCGYEVAIEMVEYTQFETIRKCCFAVSNHCRASAQANRVSLALGDQKGRYQQLGTNPCSSFRFYWFVEGARLRMGQETKPSQLC